MENVNERFLQKCDTKKKKKKEIRLHYIPVIPLGISYSRLNNFIPLHMIATVWLYWASSLQLREQGVIIVPRACMCSGPAEIPPRKISSLISLMLSFKQEWCMQLWWFAPEGHGLRKPSLKWSPLTLMWGFLSLPCALTAYCPPSEGIAQTCIFVIFCYKYKKYFILWHPSTLIILSGLYL